MTSYSLIYRNRFSIKSCFNLQTQLGTHFLLCHYYQTSSPFLLINYNSLHERISALNSSQPSCSMSTNTIRSFLLRKKFHNIPLPLGYNSEFFPYPTNLRIICLCVLPQSSLNISLMDLSQVHTHGRVEDERLKGRKRERKGREIEAEKVRRLTFSYILKRMPHPILPQCHYTVYSFYGMFSLYTYPNSSTCFNFKKEYL